MKSFMKNKIYALSIFLLLFITTSVYAQELSVGADVVSRYIWRGFDFGQSPSIQPTVEFSSSGFAIGFWGSYPFSTSGETVDEATFYHSGHSEEIDLYLSYSFDLGNSGGLSLGFTDYMFPTADGFKFTNFNDYDDTSSDGPGSHYIELNAGYTGPESFPIYLSLNVFLYNVAENPFYFQVGYTTSISDVGLDFFVGATPGDKGFYYGVDKFDFTNIGLTATRDIKITNDFSLPIFGSVIVNPATEKLFYVLGFSL